MKVLHLQKVKGIGGSERHLAALLPALAARGTAVHMGVIATGDAPRFVDELSAAAIPASILPAGPDLNPLLVRALVRLIREVRPDVVHTHLVHADLHGLLAARLSGLPAVSSVHGTPAFYRRVPFRQAGQLAGRLAARRIAISEHVARFLRTERLAPPDRIRVVPYGIVAGDWSVTPAERRALRGRLGLAPDDLVVGIAARLIPGKGHAELMRAFDQVADSEPALHLLIAGEGPEREGVERQATATGRGDRIRFLGHLDDIRGFMGICDVVAQPTQPELSEGFGLAALEAMAAGRPVLATAVGSLPEVVIDGETGLVVPPGAVDALAGAMKRLVGEPGARAEMGAKARERAASCFSLEAMVDATSAVYAEVA